MEEKNWLHNQEGDMIHLSRLKLRDSGPNTNGSCMQLDKEALIGS